MSTDLPYLSSFEWSLLISLVLPFISFILSFIISERYAWIVSFTAPLLLLIATVCSVMVFISVWDQSPYHAHHTWFNVGSMRFTVGILLNDLSVLMMLIVILISFLVHLYSIGYMAGDAGVKRYFAMLGLFTFSMLGIVVADNLLMIFVFWELVGFASYMLIGHWKEKPQASLAAQKAFILNRIGDAGFLVGLMIIWCDEGTFQLTYLDVLADSSGWQIAASLCLFCGVIGKSAQFPLMTWLPDAMEGPTPVSALIHAATMVAAGVFLLARVSHLFPEGALDIIACVGIATALMGACAALAQTDIKKVLAYSTISQLGLMVTATGAGATEAAMLHLFTHAFFKASLFLCAGSVMHALHQAQHQVHTGFDVQDIRNLGGLRKKMPFTFFAFVVCGSSLAGLPLFSGFLSKEAIFTAIYSWKGSEFNWRWIVFALSFVVSFLTVIYIFRLVWKVFCGEETLTRTLSVTEPPVVMRAPVALLSVCSLWFIVSINPLDFSGWLYSIDTPHHSGLTIFSVLWIALALLVAYLIIRRNRDLQSSVLYHNFFLDNLYTKLIVAPSLSMASFSQHFDRKWIDGFIHTSAYVQVTFAHLVGWFDQGIVDGVVRGLASVTRKLGSLTRSFQGGKIQLYIFWALFAIIIFLIWTLF